MDTSDPDIWFDEAGVCNHCHKYERLAAALVTASDPSSQALPALVKRMKKAGRGRDYDCLIGVSGGVDSTYVAYEVRELGLRPLAVHLDNGWDSALAVTNIERTLAKLGIDLYTVVLDWEEFKDLQLAFLKASTPDSEIPTDHAICAVLAQTALKHKVKYVISGSNIVSEAIMPAAWSQGIRDWKYLKAVHDRFGTVPLKTFPHFTLTDFMVTRTVRGQRWIDLLNHLPYNRADAVRTLQTELGWVDYGGKHHESVYTRFFQSCILPEKYGVDKRRGHLSTLICSGQLTRDEALSALEAPICAPAQLKSDRDFVLKKLGLTEEQFAEIMSRPAKSIADYPAYENGTLLRCLRWVYRLPRHAKLWFRPPTAKPQPRTVVPEL
jgi:N-acetyl sugar amidotransferase